MLQGAEMPGQPVWPGFRRMPKTHDISESANRRVRVGMGTPLTVLILADRPAHAERMLAELRRQGFDPDWQRVERPDEFLAALAPEPDAILADYGVPPFGALEALAALNERLDYVGGGLHIESRRGAGTRVTLRAPLTQ
jgi:hypothetical protein